MSITALSSIWLRDLYDGKFSPLHILSVLTVISFCIAIWAIKRGKRKTHARFMMGTYAGAIIAGAFTLAPGRFVSILLGYG
ncbi:MAG: DUF2306 domain-containing protein [Sneathiella sp.]|nr:DUF2306 domain-containing protein [Sneathiella sp.]